MKGIIVALMLGMTAQEPPRMQAPGDARIFEKDLAGAYFVARPLMDRYDALRSRISGLRSEIARGQIDGETARTEVETLQKELTALTNEIQRSKLYVPGASGHRVKETRSVPIGPDDLLLVDCENVEVTGWDGPDIQCVLEKTVLDDGTGEVEADFAGIELVTREATDREFFGFYLDVRDDPKFRDNAEMQADLRRFVFGEYLGRKFQYITVKGLDHEGGNRQIQVKVRSERGEGFQSSQWRRHARLTLLVPKCQGVGIRGGLKGLKVSDLHAGLTIQGQGNRDYDTHYEVRNLDGPLVADNIPIHRIDKVRGDVTVTATAYSENRGTSHGAEGVTARAYEPKDTDFRGIEGSLRARFCRANLTIGDVGGRIDVENDFGDTTWETDRELAQDVDHRAVSQSGTILVRLPSNAVGGLPMMIFTECGTMHRGPDVEAALGVWFEESMFETAAGDTARRSWIAWTQRPGTRPNPPSHDWEGAFARMRRAADALYGRPRTPGIDVLSRAGRITIAK